MTRDVAEKT